MRQQGRPGRRDRGDATWSATARSSVGRHAPRAGALCTARVVVRAGPASGARRVRVAAIVSTGIPSTRRDVAGEVGPAAVHDRAVADLRVGAPADDDVDACLGLEPVEAVEASSGAMGDGGDAGRQRGGHRPAWNVTGDPPAISTPGLGDWTAPSRSSRSQGPPSTPSSAGLGARRRAVLSGHQGEEGCTSPWVFRRSGSGTRATPSANAVPAAGPSCGETGAMADLLTLDRRDDGVAVITLANGKVNALSGALLARAARRRPTSWRPTSPARS